MKSIFISTLFVMLTSINSDIILHVLNSIQTLSVEMLNHYPLYEISIQYSLIRFMGICHFLHINAHETIRH